MTQPKPETIEREKEKLYITDAELIRRLGAPERVCRNAIAELEGEGFPRKEIANRRFWPAVKAWLDAHEMGRKLPTGRETGANLIGDIYFLASATHIKIGFSAKGFKKRIQAIRQNHYESLKLLGWVSDAPRKVEKLLHRKFKAYRTKGEWFTRSPEIEAFIEDVRKHRWHWSEEDQS